METAALKTLAAGIIANADRIAFAKYNPNETEHEIMYALVDDTEIHSERFETQDECDVVWMELMVGLASGPRPKFGRFLMIALISLQHFIGPELVETDEGDFLHLGFQGANALVFKYVKESDRLRDYALIKEFFGMNSENAGSVLRN